MEEQTTLSEKFADSSFDLRTAAKGWNVQDS